MKWKSSKEHSREAGKNIQKVKWHSGHYFVQEDKVNGVSDQSRLELNKDLDSNCRTILSRSQSINDLINKDKSKFI